MRLTLPPLCAQVLQGGFSLMLRHRLHCTIVRGPRHRNGGCGGGDDDNGSENLVPDIGPEAHEVRGSHYAILHYVSKNTPEPMSSDSYNLHLACKHPQSALAIIAAAAGVPPQAADGLPALLDAVGGVLSLLESNGILQSPYEHTKCGCGRC